MSEHTPGPWTWGENFQGLYGSGEDNEVLCFYPYEGMSLNWRRENRDADARLIAAAPELLEALRMFVVWYGRRDKHDTLLPPKMQEAELAQAMRAIAKAEGAPE